MVGFVCFFFPVHHGLAVLASLALVYVGSFGAWATGTGCGAELFPAGPRAFGTSFGAGGKYLGQTTSSVIAEALLVGAGT